MTTQIRSKVFETNSSSSHSVTVAGEEALDFGLGKDILRSGIISITGDREFGWDWEQHGGTYDKIAYMLMQCAPGDFYGFKERHGEDVIPDLVAKSENARWLVDVIERATGCMVEFKPGRNAYIDHQSHGEGSELFTDEVQMRRFLFGGSSYIQTGNDNSDPYDY